MTVIKHFENKKGDNSNGSRQGNTRTNNQEGKHRKESTQVKTIDSQIVIVNDMKIWLKTSPAAQDIKYKIECCVQKSLPVYLTLETCNNPECQRTNWYSRRRSQWLDLPRPQNRIHHCCHGQGVQARI